MGVFERISYLVEINIDDFLAKSKNVGKDLKNLIIELELAYDELKRATLGLLKELRHILNCKETDLGGVELWQRRSDLAIREGREDLAKEALRRKIRHEIMLKKYQEQEQRFRKEIKDLRNIMRRLNVKIREAKRHRELFLMQSEPKVKVKDPHSEMETQAIEKKFIEMERKEKIEDELNRLKKKIVTKKKPASKKSTTKTTKKDTKKTAKKKTPKNPKSKKK